MTEAGSCSLQGLIVHPGVVDQDYKGELQVLCSCPQVVFSISQRDRIAQLIILPSLHGCFPSSGIPRAARGIGSTGNDSAYLIMPLDSRPSLELVIEGKQFKGILDTGADKSIISSHWWPKTWPVIQSSHSLQGLGYQSCSTISSRSLSWQMDVTHISSFGRNQYLHVSIDTCSGVMFATPLTGEKDSHVIQHCLEAWSAWGKPTILKTDNGPAYTSTKFQQFCHQMNVTHLTGLPYNPQGQGIVERAHCTLKSYFIKQKGGVDETLPSVPRVAVSMALFTLNFLNLDEQGHSAAERHSSDPDRPKEMVKWKDVLTGQWKGPDPILIRSRGAICVFPQGEENPLWVPTRLTRTVKEQDEPQDDSPAPDD